MKQYMDLFQGMSTNEADGTAAADSGSGPVPEAGQDNKEKTGGNPFGMNPMDMVMGMLSPEQQSMFQMFQSDFNTEAASTDNTIARDSPPEGEQ